MANEKADMPTDQVSLPPTYAPSETYTESPPPAYRKPGMAAIKVARVVCFTLLAMTFVIGFFVVTHKWIQSRECNCQQESSGIIQHAALLAKVPNLLNSDLNNNKIEENIVKQEGIKVIPDEDNQVQEEEIMPQNQVIGMPEEKITGDPKVDEDEFEELNKDVKLPKDLLLGNPQLAGRNVHCKVEKRQRRITEGIMTQAIIVTCDDDDDSEGTEGRLTGDLPMPIVPIRPPMSLLSTIMKVLSAHPPSVENEPEEEPQHLPFPIGSLPMPLPGSMQGPFPFIRPIERPFPGPFPGPVAPILVPLRKVEIGKPFHIINRDDDSDGPELFQQPPPMMDEGRGPRLLGMNPHLRFIQRPAENNAPSLPFPLSSGAFPIRVIRLSPRGEIPEENEGPHEIHDDDEDNEGPLPLPLHHLMRFLPAHGRRIIRLRPRPPMDFSQNEPLSFPFPRGALPPPPPEELSVPHPMPEASGRALPSPVALPQGVRVVRLPFRPPPQPFPEAKLFTHMELRQLPEENSYSQEPQNDHLPNVPENQSFRPNSKEFGPPKTHTVIENAPPLVFEDEQPQEPDLPEIFPRVPIEQSIPQTRFEVPLPPRVAPEGRTSLQAELNPDAEVISQNPNPEPSQPIHRIVLN